MESMRDVLRRHLARSLGPMEPADRLVAAWPVACGKAMADRGEIVGFHDGVVEVQVRDAVWLDQMRSMGVALERELGKIAGVEVRGIHFDVKRIGRKGRQG